MVHSSHLAHRILTCPALVTLEYHLLQQQIMRGYSDPKLLEMLLYLLQAQTTLRGSSPVSVEYDASVLRGAFAVKRDNWNVENDWQSYDDVDGRECMWTLIRNCYIVKDDIISFKYPHDIAGVETSFGMTGSSSCTYTTTLL